MANFELLKTELVRSMNEQDFIYIGEGVREVEAYVSNYMSERGFKMDVFKVEEITGVRRHLKIWCRDLQFLRGYYMDITVQGEQY
jgi:hypothetical protein